MPYFIMREVPQGGGTAILFLLFSLGAFVIGDWRIHSASPRGTGPREMPKYGNKNGCTSRQKKRRRTGAKEKKNVLSSCRSYKFVLSGDLV